MSWECNRLIWSSVSLAMTSPLLCADNETWSVYTRCALLLLSGPKHPFECSITIINARLSRLGFEDLYTNTVCFTSPRPWSSEERLPSSCPGQGIDWDLLVCCFIYLFVYPALEIWDLLLCICQGHFIPHSSAWFLLSLVCKNFNLLFSASMLINYIKMV